MLNISVLPQAKVVRDDSFPCVIPDSVPMTACFILDRQWRVSSRPQPWCLGVSMLSLFMPLTKLESNQNYPPIFKHISIMNWILLLPSGFIQVVMTIRPRINLEHPLRFACFVVWLFVYCIAFHCFKAFEWNIT